jgi:hypothetical protein
MTMAAGAICTAALAFIALFLTEVAISVTLPPEGIDEGAV